MTSYIVQYNCCRTIPLQCSSARWHSRCTVCVATLRWINLFSQTSVLDAIQSRLVAPQSFKGDFLLFWEPHYLILGFHQSSQRRSNPQSPVLVAVSFSLVSGIILFKCIPNALQRPQKRTLCILSDKDRSSVPLHRKNQTLSEADSNKRPPLYFLHLVFS